MRKVWYHQILIQNNLGFIVLILTYIPIRVTSLEQVSIAEFSGE